MTYKRFSPALAAALAAICVAIPGVSQAGWHGGVFIGLPPIVVGPPAYYYPPAYAYPPAYYYPPAYDGPPPAYSYAPPPPATGAPQGADSKRPFGGMCYAGVYQCAASGGARVDDGCVCPGIGAPSYGVVR